MGNKSKNPHWPAGLHHGSLPPLSIRKKQNEIAFKNDELYKLMNDKAESAKKAKESLDTKNPETDQKPLHER